MRTRLFLGAVFILSLPLWVSTSSGDKLASPVPLATVAYAGHTTLGLWCDCGTPGCICDPGEMSSRSNVPVSDQTKKHSDHSASPIIAHSHSGFDWGTGALMLALALFLWAKLRA